MTTLIGFILGTILVLLVSTWYIFHGDDEAL